MRFAASPMSLSVSDAISGHIKEIESQFFFAHSLVMIVVLDGKNSNGRKRSAFFYLALAVAGGLVTW